MVSDWLRGQPCLLEELKGIREEEEYEQSEFSLHASLLQSISTPLYNSWTQLTD